uniref:Putative secreted protein n=1 Tax=Rhipicephalus microplus TaxID=6941 RepID=A0A6M2DAY0_RHIMP
MLHLWWSACFCLDMVVARTPSTGTADVGRTHAVRKTTREAARFNKYYHAFSRGDRSTYARNYIIAWLANYWEVLKKSTAKHICNNKIMSLNF